MARRRNFLGEVGNWLRKFERRPGRTYYAICHHPYRCNMTDPYHRCTEVMGYAGQTRRKSQTRWDEHAKGGGAFRLKQQPWADTIIRWEVDRYDKCISGFKLDRWERRLIILGKEPLGLPFYNVKFNKLNPNRVPPWEAREQRAQRDAARARRGTSASQGDMPRLRAKTERFAARGAGVSIRRDPAGNIVGGTWFGDRGDEFRRNLIGG